MSDERDPIWETVEYQVENSNGQRWYTLTVHPEGKEPLTATHAIQIEDWEKSLKDDWDKMIWSRLIYLLELEMGINHDE